MKGKMCAVIKGTWAFNLVTATCKYYYSVPGVDIYIKLSNIQQKKENLMIIGIDYCYIITCNCLCENNLGDRLGLI